MLCRIEHALYGRHARYTYRAGRKTSIFVGVVGRVDLEMGKEDAAQLKVAHGKLYRGVGLEQHASMEAVEVEPCYLRLLIILIGLFVNDGGQRDDLVGGEPLSLGLGHA